MSQCKAFTYFTVSKTANQSWSYYSDMSLTMGPQFCSQRGTNPQCGSNLSNHTKKSYSKVVSLTNWWELDGQKYKNNFSTSFDKLILINSTDFKDQFWWETCIISWMKVLSFVLKAEHFTNAPPPFTCTSFKMMRLSIKFKTIAPSLIDVIVRAWSGQVCRFLFTSN